MKRNLAICIVIALVLCSLCSVAYADEALDYSNQCTFTYNVDLGNSDLFLDSDVETQLNLPAGNAITMYWGANVPVRHIYYELGNLSNGFAFIFLDENDAVISTVNCSSVFICNVVDVPNGAHKTTIFTTEKLAVATLHAYGDGDLPTTCHSWDNDPQDLDYLVFAAHQCDETVTFGAAISILQERGANGGLVYMTTKNIVRTFQSLDAISTLGMSTHPIIAEFRNRQDAETERAARGYWNEDDVMLYLVRNIRKYKPELVITHAEDGDGDGQDAITSRLVVAAVENAANSEFDTESVTQYGAWNVNKLYLHLAETNGITLNENQKIGNYSLDEVLTSADKCYSDAHDTRKVPDLTGDNSALKYGLVYSSVGEDTQGDNMLENLSIDLSGTATQPIGNPSDPSEPEPEQSYTYSDDFASPIPVAPPTPVPQSGLTDDTDAPADIGVKVEDSLHDNVAKEGREKSIWLVAAGAVLSLILFVFTFRWFRYSRSTFVAVLICLLPLLFMTAAYFLIVNIYIG
ncbi:MAG: hypothetical protein PHT58_06135 [Eubacteriales bacterium]|nr:hypothetical protein [Eubacteriales bacterium]